MFRLNLIFSSFSVTFGDLPLKKTWGFSIVITGAPVLRAQSIPSVSPLAGRLAGLVVFQKNHLSYVHTYKPRIDTVITYIFYLLELLLLSYCILYI